MIDPSRRARALRRALPALLAALACLWLLGRPSDNPVVGAAERFNAEVAVAAGATYVSLRAVNAALSVAQEVEVGGSLGVSASAQPLKWLEPVDDTVERVSSLVFAMALIAGVLSLALAPVAAIGLALLAGALLGVAVCACTGPGPRLLQGGLRGAAGLGLVLALVLPAVFALGAWAGEALTRPAWAEAEATLSAIAGEARALLEADASGPQERGWLGRQTDLAGRYFGAAGTFWNEADALLAASLTLVGVFLLRMVVLPLVLLLAALALLRSALMHRGPGGDAPPGP